MNNKTTTILEQKNFLKTTYILEWNNIKKIFQTIAYYRCVGVSIDVEGRKKNQTIVYWSG